MGAAANPIATAMGDAATLDLARKQQERDDARQFQMNALTAGLQSIDASSPTAQQDRQAILNQMAGLYQHPFETPKFITHLKGSLGRLFGRQPAPAAPQMQGGETVPGTAPVTLQGLSPAPVWPQVAQPTITGPSPAPAQPAPGGPPRPLPPAASQGAAAAGTMNPRIATDVQSVVPPGIETPLAPARPQGGQDIPVDKLPPGSVIHIGSGGNIGVSAPAPGTPPRPMPPGVPLPQDAVTLAATPAFRGGAINAPAGAQAPLRGQPAPGGPQRPLPPQVAQSMALAARFMRSPSELAAAQYRAQRGMNLESMQDTFRLMDQIQNDPNLSDEQKRERINVLTAGMTGSRARAGGGTNHLYFSPDGKDWGEFRDGEQPEGWKVGSVTQTGRRGTPLGKPYQFQGAWYQAMRMPDGTIQRQAMPEGFTGPPAKDSDQYEAILKQEAMGQPLSAEQQAQKTAYEQFVQKRYIEPGVQRAIALSDNRYVAVLDPANPESVVMMKAGEAARSGANTPASLAFQVDKAMTRYATSGQMGQNITAFNTAKDHLRILSDLATALNNGDTQMFNSLRQDWQAATGDEVPMEFDAVKNAVAGELVKTFRGASATDQEMKAVETTINRAMSPQQLAGVIQYYSNLMNSKLGAMRQQVEAGKRGLPAFPENLGPASGQPAPGGPARPTPPGAGVSDRQFLERLGQP